MLRLLLGFLLIPASVLNAQIVPSNASDEKGWQGSLVCKVETLTKVQADREKMLRISLSASLPDVKVLDLIAAYQTCVSIKTLLGKGLLPAIVENNGRYELKLTGYGLSSLDGLQDMRGYEKITHLCLAENDFGPRFSKEDLAIIYSLKNLRECTAPGSLIDVINASKIGAAQESPELPEHIKQCKFSSETDLDAFGLRSCD